MAANVVVAFAEKSGDIPEGILAVYATYIAPITALGIILAKKGFMASQSYKTPVIFTALDNHLAF
jgi:hypothetical protein